MTVAESIAEEVEQKGGPRAGLAVWRALAARTSRPATRALAILRAIRCASTLPAPSVVAELVRSWSELDGGSHDLLVASGCRALVSAGTPALALDLAEREARRAPSARALYCFARLLETSGDGRAANAFADVASRAALERRHGLEAIARARRASLLARSWSSMSEALAEARRADVTVLPAAMRIVVGGVLLHASSRFTRATALGILDAVALGPDDRHVLRSLAVVARWVDETRDAMSALEVDRVVAMFSRENVARLAPRAVDVARRLGRVAVASDADVVSVLSDVAAGDPELCALQARARDALEGRFEPVHERDECLPNSPGERRARREAEVVDAFVAIRDGHTARARLALASLARGEESGREILPASVADVARLALANDELRSAALGLLRARLRKVDAGWGSSGLRAWSDALGAAGESELALVALRAAAAVAEPGAAEALGRFLLREGYRLANERDSAEALAKLREARALLGGEARSVTRS